VKLPRNVGYLLFALAIFVILSQWIIFGVAREHWFDVSFSLETVHKMRVEGVSSIDWGSHDVHPPLAYFPFYVWSYFNPGFSEYHWAQELSVVWGILFLGFAWFGLTYVFGRHGAFAVPFLAIGTTYLHYFTEVRMYAFLLLLSVIAFNAAVRKFEGWWVLWGSLALFAMPLTHYFATMAIPVYVFIGFVLMKRAGEWDFWDPGSRRRVFFPLIGGLIGLAYALSIALLQRARVDGTWFAAAKVTSWPSAAMYNIFMLEQNDAPAGLFIAMYVLFLALLVFLAWKAFKVISGRTRTSEDVLLLLMGSTVMLPLLGLLVAPLLGGVSNLYHHRFFLVTGWMFAAAVFVLLAKWMFSREKEEDRLLSRVFVVGVAVVMLGMVQVYASSAHYELENVLKMIPCDDEQATIVHESPFSALPANVYAREHRCAWRNVVSTKITRRMANGAGFDVMREEDIYWNLTLPRGDYYVVYVAGTIPIDGSEYVIHKEDGVELWKVTRWKTEADASNMSWWVDNVWYDPDREYVRIGDVPAGGCCYPKSCKFEVYARGMNCTCVYAVRCEAGK